MIDEQGTYPWCLMPCHLYPANCVIEQVWWASAQGQAALLYFFNQLFVTCCQEH
jgi:hypothetical protein